VRARGESLGVVVEGVGLIERAERLILLIAVAVTHSLSRLISSVLFYALLTLSLITLLQRAWHVTSKLRES